MKAVRRTPVGRVLLEAALVAVVGAAFAFAANHVSPRGLALDRDYFPAETNDVVRVAVIAAPADSPAGTNPAAPSSLPPPAVPTTGKALQLIDGRQTVQLLHDSHLKPGAIVFIDARDEEHYLAATSRGLMNSIPIIRKNIFPPYCRSAGRRNKSWFTAMAEIAMTARRQPFCFRTWGLPNQKIFIYGGGITEWSTNHQPVETGVRNSGNVNITIQ